MNILGLISQLIGIKTLRLTLCLVNLPHTIATFTHTRGAQTHFSMFMWHTHPGRVRTPLGKVHMLT